MSPITATLPTCSTWSFRWSAAAAARRRRGGVPPARSELAVRPDEPHLITPARRSRRARLLARPLRGRAPRSHRRRQGARPRRPRSRRSPSPCAPGWRQLLTWGVVDVAADRRPRTDPPIGRPAPRRRPGHARWRRGDGAASRTSTSCRRCGCGPWSRDSVGLSSADRQRNIAGRVRVVRAGRGRGAGGRRHRDHRRHRRANRSASCKRPGPRGRPFWRSPTPDRRRDGPAITRDQSRVKN